MTYLAQIYWLPLLIALVGGLWWGWKTCSPENNKRWGGLVPFVVLLFVVGLIAAYLKWVPGRPGLWLDTALLFATAFFGGCCIGCLLKKMFGTNAATPALAAAAAAPVARAAAPSAPAKLAVAAPAPAAAAPASAPAPTAPAAPVAAAAVGLTGAAAAADAMARGKKPAGLAAPRGGKPDDLKLVRGIGPQNEGRLHALGIWHFDQIAKWTADESLWVGGYLAFPGRIEREEWVSQAGVLAQGGTSAFAERVKRGEVATSKDDGSMGQGNVGELFDGTRPAGIAAPRDGKGDDLKLINGVGRAIEQKLHALGIWHFDQIAKMSDAELRYISSFSGFPGRAIRENWAGECRILASGGETEHSKAVKAGKIPTSLDEPPKTS